MKDRRGRGRTPPNPPLFHFKQCLRHGTTPHTHTTTLQWTSQQPLGSEETSCGAGRSESKESGISPWVVILFLPLVHKVSSMFLSQTSVATLPLNLVLFLFPKNFHNFLFCKIGTIFFRRCLHIQRFGGNDTKMITSILD